MKWMLRAVLAAQVAFFAIWGRSLVMSFVPAPAGERAVAAGANSVAVGDQGIATVWLATEPVDPRDLLAGRFVALRYGMMDPAHATCALPLAADLVYVELAPTGRKVATAEGEVEISDAVACSTAPPPVGDGHVWITGRVDKAPGRVRLVYGIEKMFVPEFSPLRDAKSGSVVAKVAVNEAFAPRLLALVATTGSVAPPPGSPPAP